MKCRDKYKVLDAEITEGDFYYKNPRKQHVIYERVIRECKDLGKGSSKSVLKLYFKNALRYDKENKKEKAVSYNKYAYDISSLEYVYGPNHPKTKIILNKLLSLH